MACISSETELPLSKQPPLKITKKMTVCSSAWSAERKRMNEVRASNRPTDQPVCFQQPRGLCVSAYSLRTADRVRVFTNESYKTKEFLKSWNETICLLILWLFVLCTNKWTSFKVVFFFAMMGKLKLKLTLLFVIIW